MNSSLQSFLITLTNHSLASSIHTKTFKTEKGLNFQSLLQRVKEISKDSSHPYFPILKEHHLLFSYILDNSMKSDISFSNMRPDRIEESFCMNRQKKFIEFRVSRIPYNEGYHLLFEFTNETQRKQNVELNTLNEHKTKILSHVAHEFRTPLNSIIGNLELMQDMEEIPLRIKDNHLKPGLFSSTLLLNYVNDILDFAQMRSKKLKMNYVNFKFLDHISTIIKIMEVIARKKKIKFHTEIDSKIPNNFTSDPNRLTQILLNLLSNAFKFTAPKNGEVILRINPDQNNNLVFDICDNGIGISEENMQNLFKEFGKIDTLENNLMNPGGVGLGLIISQKFAEEMGPPDRKGFKVSSEIGQGSCFSFCLEDKTDAEYSPQSKEITQKSSYILSSVALNDEDDEKNCISNKNRNLSGLENYKYNGINNSFQLESGNIENIDLCISTDVNPAIKSAYLRNGFSPTLKDLKCFPLTYCLCPKILVVDDDMFNVSYLQNALKILGFSSEFATNGEEAIQALKNRVRHKCCDKCRIFKIIFMDSEMPVLNGLKAATVIKSLHNYKNVVLIGVTGNSSSSDINNFLKAGADKVYPKPLTKLKIMDILSSYKKLLED